MDDCECGVWGGSYRNLYCHSESWLLWSLCCGCGCGCGCGFSHRCPCRQLRSPVIVTDMNSGTIQDGFHVAALNYVVSKGATEEEDLLSVTLCTRGSTEAYLEKDPSATLLKPQHAWHHPATFLKSKGDGFVRVCGQVPSPMGPMLCNVLAKGLVAH